MEHLLNGDRPWRVRVTVCPRTSRRDRVVGYLAIVALVVVALTSPVPHLADLGAVVWAVAWWRPRLWLVGGGAPPLSADEAVGWEAFDALAQQDAERAARENRNR